MYFLHALILKKYVCEFQNSIINWLMSICLQIIVLLLKEFTHFPAMQEALRLAENSIKAFNALHVINFKIN